MFMYVLTFDDPFVYHVCMYIRYVQMEIFCSTHTGVSVWRRNLIDLNAQQFWLQQSIDEYRRQV